jgi:hypothetical protein
MNVVEVSSPAQIREAIEHVRVTPGLRNKRGEEILNRLLDAPNNEIPRSDLWAEFGAGPLSLHFGTFCKNVACQLGDTNPDPYALAETAISVEGVEVLRLKVSVVTAIRG